MSFPRYPEYKESGVEWLGEVPGHWEVCALNYRYEIALGKMLDQKRISGSHLAPYLRNTDVQWGEINTNDLPQMDFEGNDLNRYRLRRGDLLVCEGGEVGRAAIWKAPIEECCYQKALHRLRARNPKRDSAELLYFAFCTATKLDVFSSNGGKSTIAHLPAETLRRYRFPFPPPAEQTAIAAFLDRETAKIDALVAEQRRLIDLLKEKRQAVISHAVTKGLNPDAPMKDSGIEWLGEVPAHWEVLSLRRCTAYVQTGGTPSSEPPAPATDIGDGMVWYTPGDFGDLLRLGDSARRISSLSISAGESRIFPAGSVLVVSIGATLGKVGYAGWESSANQQINAVIPNEKMNGYFLAYSLSVKSDVMRYLSNASTIGIMNQEKTKDICVAVPPLKEQVAISEFLDSQTTKLDTLTAEAQRAIDLLQERRTALISAAVTGQIDVRGVAAVVE